MNCKDYQKKFLEEGAEAISEHLTECSECRDFANFANETIKLQRERNDFFLPRLEIDEKIKAYARKKCQSFSHYASTRPFIPKALSLAASILIILATGIFLYNKVFINAPKKDLEQIININNKANRYLNIKWEQLGMEEEIFELTADILLSKELLNYSSINGTLNEDLVDDEDNLDLNISFELTI